MIFHKIYGPPICKKSQKSGNLRKKIFRLKQPKLPLYSFETPFVQSTTNFRPVFLKKEVSHFQEICDSGYEKSSKNWEPSNKFFLLETT